MSGMTVYFVRRLMLVPITFVVITCMVYSILRIVPGGPIEQAETMMKLAATSGEGGGGGGAGEESGMQLDEDAMRELEEYYALDRGILVGYLQWLGIWPRTLRTRVPPVPLTKNAEAVARLEAAATAVAEAEAALTASIGERGLVAREGRLWETLAPAAVPPDVDAEAKRLAARTFGERYPLQDYLAGKGLAWVDGQIVRPLAEADAADPAVKDALEKATALESARVARRTAEQETGYWLDEAGRPVQLGFRPLHALNEVRKEATDRIEALLGPLEMIAYAGKVYRHVTPEEREAKGKKGFFDEAQALVDEGFGKRDDLLAFLGREGYTWRNNEYYVLVGEEDRKTHAEPLVTADALIAARDLANRKLEQVEEEQNLRITNEGRLYVLDVKRSGILQLDFGKSYSYNEPVLSLIGSRMEISIQFGLIGYFLTWIVCVPLGVFKAIKHRSLFDSATSVLVFLGYSIPGFVLCLLLLSSVATHLGLPLGGYKPDNIEELGWWDSVVGRARHMLIPVAGYMVTQFAAMTILMKNSLLENLGQDYVRTAFAKGLSEKRVIFVHALRNSLIPITSGIGHALALLFAGSFLIEKACNIPGMGLLGFEAILMRDYPIILGLLVFLVLIQLTGNILSDIIWALIDPRIRFGR